MNRLVWTWTNPVNDASGVPVFAIDPANGTLTVRGLVNFEVRSWRTPPLPVLAWHIRVFRCAHAVSLMWCAHAVSLMWCAFVVGASTARPTP